MVIPEQLRKTVVFLCYRDSKNILRYSGTAFLFMLEHTKNEYNFTYMVTAKHVIVGIKEKSIDGKVLLRVNLKGGGTELIETEANDWFSDADKDPTDVAVIDSPIRPNSQYDISHIFSDLVKDYEDQPYWKRPGVGDEAVIIGLFVNHVGKQRNIPIVRIGNIAAMPEERIATKHFAAIEAFLIESRSIGGLSGSPVFCASCDAAFQ